MNSREKIKLYSFIELAIWLLIIVVGIGFFRYNSIKKHSEFKTYQLFMQDVDGLIVGSSVRMMGVPIGHITKVKVVRDYIYVKFIVTEKELEIPKGVVATVEFNGMGGSKSLEIYPPDEVSKASGDLIAIKQTNRLGAALGLVNDMFDKLGSIMVRCETFSDEIAKIMPQNKTQQVSIDDIENSVNETSENIDEINKVRTDIMDNVKGLYNE